MWKEYNPNPTGVKTDDCAVRDMMDNAPDESTRAEFQRFIDKIERR